MSGIPDNLTNTPPPLAYDHIRILGRYSFTLHRAVQDGHTRPLKPFPTDI